ncbi:MAG: hypothetical protein JO364_00545 [Pseudonocardiales bacterium]|nr:hypothetical protein [Pseudonocardiales bacterium]MBV9028800.1 hypothetical protein [Pseudonocardiales bacterium]
MRKRNLLLVAGASLAALVLTVGTAMADPPSPPSFGGLFPLTVQWSPSGLPQPAWVTNGPWTLGQGPATLDHQNKGLCDTFPGGTLQNNPGTNLMQPYYFPQIRRGPGGRLDGYFDYRIKDTDEAVAHGTSTDGGLTWSVDGVKLRLNGTCPANDSSTNAAGNGDNGQGHPFIMTVPTLPTPKTFLYTIDRVSSVGDIGGLTIHDITGGFSGLNNIEPVTTATPVPAGITQTSGLQNPDGILGVVPGTGTNPLTNPTEILYLKKVKGSKSSPAAGLDPTKLCTNSQSQPYTSKNANYDRTELRIATTADGNTFTDGGAVSGLNNPNDNAGIGGFRYVGPNGTILRQLDGSYGLFFSGGNCQDGDSDAYHFIGYAHSRDAVHWTVDNGASNPLVQVDYTYPTTGPQKYYSGRVYGPQVLVNGLGSATMIFSGYRTGKPLPDVGTGLGVPTAYTPVATEAANYRTIMVQQLHFCIGITGPIPLLTDPTGLICPLPPAH